MNSICWFLISVLLYSKTVVINSKDAASSIATSAQRVYRNAFINDHNEMPSLYGFNKAINVSTDRYGTDNRKPAFRGCKDYAPKLKEEQSPNTFVIKVEAIDPDQYDSITYSFEKSVTERAKFRINSKTGEIVTSYTFDRDEPIREKEVGFME